MIRRGHAGQRRNRTTRGSLSRPSDQVTAPLLTSGSESRNRSVCESAGPGSRDKRRSMHVIGWFKSQSVSSFRLSVNTSIRRFVSTNGRPASSSALEGKAGRKWRGPFTQARLGGPGGPGGPPASAPAVLFSPLPPANVCRFDVWACFLIVPVLWFQLWSLPSGHDQINDCVWHLIWSTGYG